MVTEFDWISLVSILLIALAGGYYPLARRDSARTVTGFPLGQAFAAGVFLALSLFIMLPNGIHLFSKVVPNGRFPLAEACAAGSYIFLLALGHVAYSRREKAADQRELTAPAIPIIMTVMIAIPSFLLGTALGVSETASAIVIFVAIMAHKGSAGFALALSMVRSTMTRAQTIVLYCLFALSTPVGILVGADVHQYLTGHTMILFKAVILSLASGVFLYMATLHEMKHAPLIVDCCTPKGFVSMVAGLVLTAMVRYALSFAHSGHPG